MTLEPARGVVTQNDQSDFSFHFSGAGQVLCHWLLWATIIFIYGGHADTLQPPANYWISFTESGLVALSNQSEELLLPKFAPSLACKAAVSVSSAYSKGSLFTLAPPTTNVAKANIFLTPPTT